MPIKTIEILLVEDSKSDVELIRSILGACRDVLYSIQVASRLQAALEVVATLRIKAVLLDLNLPDSRGLETLLSLRARAPEVAIVILTGQDDQGLAVKALENGAQDYIVKDRMDSFSLSHSIRFGLLRHELNSGPREDIIRTKPATRETHSLPALLKATSDAADFGDCTLTEMESGMMATRFGMAMAAAIRSKGSEKLPGNDDRLKSLARDLANKRASSHDVFEIFDLMINKHVEDTDQANRRTFGRESRGALIKLLGLLLEIYRQPNGQIDQT
ncbi:MAG: response regulator [Planctomycetota bacterium]|nr:response regulator [Planctomycetota bacterium]MDA1143101.1 response regulator [Planctomycetota bacterium]